MPVDDSVYESQRRGVRDQYTANLATNEYSRFLSQQRGQRQQGDYAKDFGRAYPKFSAGWGQRGFAGAGARSGLYQAAMQRYVGDYSQGKDRMMQDYSEEQRGFDLATQRYEAELQRALADIEAAKQRDIAATAAAIQGLG